MSRIKKSRTAGNSQPKFDGNRKETSEQAKEARERKRKAKLKGNKAGHRNAIDSKSKGPRNGQQKNSDKRIGSKKPIALTVTEKAASPAKPKVNLQPKAKVIKSQLVKKISPEKELADIENNDRLNELLEQLDEGQTLSQVDQAWVDKQMQRHQELMVELGWIDEDSGEEDLLQQFDDASSALDEFK